MRLCFDIAHTFTMKEKSSEIPVPPEAIFETIPEDLLYGIHLGDYVPETMTFHPPLHYEAGPLKRKNLENSFKIFRDKGVKAVVIETAVRSKEELAKGVKIIEDETAYILEVMKSAGIENA